MPNKYEAILPDGSVAKRTSKNRTYVACIAIREGYELALAWANGKGWADTERSNYAYYVRELNPETRQSKYSADYADRYAEHIAGCANADDYVAKCLAERLAFIEARKADGYYDRWGAASWAGRPDLIAGAMRSAQTSLVAEVRACPAILK